MNATNNENHSPGRVRLLREDVARKIAAGEVIDRPYSVLRELLDNAIDSGANQIQVSISEGGTKKIRVSDNGCGMTKEDLSLCHHSHATSKIQHEDDLNSIHTLGFRGEALSSIATVSKLEIVSRTATEEQGWKLTVHGGKELGLQPTAWGKGTSIIVEDLFFSLPARKKFLKRSSAESSMCRSTLVEKALAFPNIQFEYILDGSSRLSLPAITENGDDIWLQRVLSIYSDLGDPSLFIKLKGSGDGFSFQAVLGEPGISRGDRKMIQVYANNRRIQEFALIQAIEYGYQGFLPGGRYPVAFLFLTVDPSLVDFNVHPAKREAKFSILPEIHRRVSRSVQEILSHSAKRTMAAQQKSGIPHDDLFSAHRFSTEAQGEKFLIQSYQSTQSSPSMAQTSRDIGIFTGELSTPSTRQPETSLRIASEYYHEEYRYIGQVFNLFLVVEMKKSLYLIDMHAAHEKIIYEKLRSDPKPQNLLVPLALESPPDSEDGDKDFAIDQIQIEQLERLGIKINKDESGRNQLTALPGGLIGKETILIAFLQGYRGNIEDLERTLYATVACRSAVMDGDPITDNTAHAIIQGALSLDNPRCPHGRPIWFELNREELFQLVGRT